MNVIHPLTKYRNSQTPPKSRADLARDLNVTRMTITRWEEGTRKIDKERLADIASKTGIPPKDLRPDLTGLAELIGGSQ